MQAPNFFTLKTLFIFFHVCQILAQKLNNHLSSISEISLHRVVINHFEVGNSMKQLVNTFPSFYGIRRFIVVLTDVLHRTPS